MFGQYFWCFQSRFLLQQKQKKLLVFASIGFIECGPVQESQTFPAVSQTVFPKPKGQERTSRSFNRDKANGGAAAAMKNWLSFSWLCAYSNLNL
jgi:hypothetical protein